MPHFFKAILPILLVFAGSHAFAGSPQEDYLRQPIERRGFDEEKWKSLTSGMDYAKDIEKQKAPQRSPSLNAGWFAEAFKFLAVAIGIALLVLLFVKMADGKDFLAPRNRKLKPLAADASLENIEENLHDAQLEDPIRRAAEAGDYALAVRLHYLAVLRELSLKKRIRWKRDKTNGEYLRELSGTPLLAPVWEATLVFERVWYGKAEVRREDFLKLETSFRNARAAIS